MSDTGRLPACPGPAPAQACMPAVPDGVEALILDFDGTLADTAPGNERRCARPSSPTASTWTPAGTGSTSACPSTTCWPPFQAATRCLTPRSSHAVAPT